jgi:hypothetical protein
LPNSEIESFKLKLHSIISAIPSFEIIGLAEDYFGPKNDELVRRVGDTKKIRGIHNNLLDFVMNKGGILRHYEYTGNDGYNPHVTKQNDGWIEEGEIIKLTQIQIAQRLKDPAQHRKIILNARLGNL